MPLYIQKAIVFRITKLQSPSSCIFFAANNAGLTYIIFSCSLIHFVFSHCSAISNTSTNTSFSILLYFSPHIISSNVYFAIYSPRCITKTISQNERKISSLNATKISRRIQIYCKIQTKISSFTSLNQQQILYVLCSRLYSE